LAVLALGGAMGVLVYATLLSLAWRGLWQDMRALARL
jgi:hypothetical protein